ncbi:MAG TPA: TlpA disulfide reductase family protein [Candidatus Acidoferrum sp.]
MTNDNLEPHGEPAPEPVAAKVSEVDAAPSPESVSASTLLPPPLLEIGTERGRPPIRLTTAQIAAIVALAVFTLFITWRTKALEKAIAKRDPVFETVSKPAPGFSLPALDGRTVSLADYAGKKVVVSYWASWCGPCKVELPQLSEFYKQYHKADSDFEVLAISVDENRADAEHYASDEKLPFPVLLDKDSKVADAYAVEGIPTLFVIDKTGKVKYAHTGLDETMQFQLMSQLGIKYPGMDNGGTDKDAADKDGKAKE